MPEEIKVLIDGFTNLGTILESNATVMYGKYYYLPAWFEKSDNDEYFIVHTMDDQFPPDLKQGIEDFKEDVEIKMTNNDFFKP